MQSKSELEDWYSSSDPWGYTTNPDDIKRKKYILRALEGEYDRALDIANGEGWITGMLPAKEIHGIEISDKAAKNYPETVKRVTEPIGKYDLVLCTGALYEQYDHAQFAKWIRTSASKHILIAGIRSWLIDYQFGDLILYRKFKYRDMEQIIKLYEV